MKSWDSLQGEVTLKIETRAVVQLPCPEATPHCCHRVYITWWSVFRISWTCCTGIWSPRRYTVVEVSSCKWIIDSHNASLKWNNLQKIGVVMGQREIPFMVVRGSLETFWCKKYHKELPSQQFINSGQTGQAYSHQFTTWHSIQINGFVFRSIWSIDQSWVLIKTKRTGVKICEIPRHFLPSKEMNGNEKRK